MKTIELDEATVHLAQLVNDVTGGETVEITRRGRPVARLVPPPAKDRAEIRAVIDGWRKFREREGITLGDDLTIRDLIEEGRRY